MHFHGMRDKVEEKNPNHGFREGSSFYRQERKRSSGETIVPDAAR